MRTLDRNKRKFYYCLYSAKTKMYDAKGNFTGDYKPGYSQAVEARGHISAATGSADIEQFGTEISYDKTIVLQGINWPIDEHTVLFIDSDPSYTGGVPNYDYRVTKVAVSLNHTTLAIKRVEP